MLSRAIRQISEMDFVTEEIGLKQKWNTGQLVFGYLKSLALAIQNALWTQLF